MGNLHLNSGHIQDFEVNLVTEERGHDIAVVTIYTEKESIKFRISTDDRHPNLEQIMVNLKSGLQMAMDTDKDFMINEFPERTYLFVTYPSGNQEQYTGSRVKM